MITASSPQIRCPLDTLSNEQLCALAALLDVGRGDFSVQNDEDGSIVIAPAKS